MLLLILFPIVLVFSAIVSYTALVLIAAIASLCMDLLMTPWGTIDRIQNQLSGWKRTLSRMISQLNDLSLGNYSVSP